MAETSYCLIGGDVGKSLSPAIYALVGVEYVAKNVSTAGIGRFLSSFKGAGFNVTAPHKREIIKYLDGVDERAAACGAVNVVKRDGGKLIGYNTDFDGVKYMIKRAGYSLKGKRVLILGGGATKNTVYNLAESEGALSIDYVSRAGMVNYRNCYFLTGTEVIINTTPVGSVFGEDVQLVDLARFPALEAVFDCAYLPLKTSLIESAQELSLITGGGLSMLVKQALCSLDIWQGGSHTDEECENIINKLTKELTNIVLVGMPSCGKSSIGALLARRSGKRFIDTDAEIERVYGASPEKLIDSFGEDKFRYCERQVVKSLRCETGAVIATGGGLPIDAANVSDLKQNGVFVYVMRDLKKLDGTGRPTLSRGARELFEARSKVYEGVADFIVENDSSIEECVEKIELI